MADGLSIPGVSNKYGTKELVEQLMETERGPLNRERARLEQYENEQAAWRSVNHKMSTLRESVKTLYSFDNPFNNKIATSSDENAITVDADRDADFGSFKIDIMHPATCDRFLSSGLDKNMKVEAGKYSFTVGKKTVEFNWKGGKLSEFVTALNKRSSNIVKASIIGVSPKKQALLIESLKPGIENKLVLTNKALDLAYAIDMVSDEEKETTVFSSDLSTFKTVETKDMVPQSNIPQLSISNVTSDGKKIDLGARSGIEIPVPQEVLDGKNQKIDFTISISDSQDLSESVSSQAVRPLLPDPGIVEYKEIVIHNLQSDTTLSGDSYIDRSFTPVEDERYVFIKNSDGTEEELNSESICKNDDGSLKVSINVDDYPNIQSIIIRNSNTGKKLSMSVPEAYDSITSIGYKPNHPITVADDAEFKYEGIPLTRPTNDIDDVVPNVTLHLHDRTEKTATIKIDPDTESAKDALINFVGNYNQLIAEFNILTTNKPEVVTELDYLSEDEQAKAIEKLGMFQGDSSLTNGKSSMQRVVSSSYRYSEDSEISMLAQIGISTNASGVRSGYNASQTRGYLEIDEKKLDAALKDNLEGIKNLFGYDTDSDMIIDNGIGYLLDKQLNAWVQTGGILAIKNSALETKIKASNTNIANLETKLDAKEAELRRTYSAMEGSLGGLESQQTAIENFNNSMNNNR